MAILTYGSGILPLLRPETELLVCCSRVRMELQFADRIKFLLQDPIDWDYLLRNAFTNGVMPLLQLHLSAVAPGPIPDTVKARLEKFYLTNTAHNIMLTKEMLALLEVFSANRIEALPYKGPAMAFHIYGDLSYRQFGDLDLLIRKEDVLSAKRILLSQGFESRLKLTPGQEKNFLKFQSSYDFQRELLIVEMHWKVVEGYYFAPIDMASLAPRRLSVPILGSIVSTTSDEDLLLILCVESARDFWERILRVCDIAELLRACPSLDWDSILQSAGEIGCRRILLIGVLLAKELLGAPVPDEILIVIQKDRNIRLLAAKIANRLLSEQNEIPIFEDSRFQPMYIQMRERLADKAGYVIGLLLTPHTGEWSLITLPGFLSFLYYFVRPVRLIGKFGLRILSRILSKIVPEWKKLKELSLNDLSLFVKALVLIRLNAIGIRFAGLRQWQKFLAGLAPVFDKTRDQNAQQLPPARQIARMVRAAARYGLGHSNCLQQSLALWWLLRRQHILSELRIGMHEEKNQIKGHAWVEWNGIVINDSEDVTKRYSPLPNLDLVPKILD